MGGRDEIITWSDVIGDLSPQDVDGLDSSLPADEQGRAIHSYLESEYSGMDGVSFEDPVIFEDMESGEVRQGRYDCFDGNFVYEFKTKYDRAIGSDLLPLEEDVEQVSNYARGLDLDWGVLVYISRSSFEVDRYIVGV